ncbi:UNKNOWN [Stylonychia lemnae]|uniref:Uncharacterized protein n=1 Tax=Stylonychia lemnae TaxID=5949 RepID=A0A078B7V1_STYLE|nr:UNKNOWN [Stylonychia lemnae]|eukprot:CDW90595.1 UNKNOWN [Stylonychia lemnae]
MKKFITIVGAILVGTVAATQITTEEKVVDGLIHGLQAAQKDVQIIKGQLQSIAHRRRARSVDQTPNVEAQSNLLEYIKSLDIKPRPITTRDIELQEYRDPCDYIRQCLPKEFRNNQPKVEGFFGFGESVVSHDLRGIDFGIQNAIQTPHVEGFLSGLHELTGIAGDLTGLGLGIYSAVHPNVQASIMEQKPLYYSYAQYLSPKVQMWDDATLAAYNLRFGNVIYPHQ